MEKQNETIWKTYISWEPTRQPWQHFPQLAFLVFAASPWNSRPATLTVHLKTGKCPGPCRLVVYTGNDTPALCVHSPANKFLYTPVSSCTIFRPTEHVKEIMPQKACCSQTPKKKSFTQHEHLKWLTHRQDTKWQQTYKDPCSKRLRKVLVEKACWEPPP
jgi:hypothetical protein